MAKGCSIVESHIAAADNGIDIVLVGLYGR